jgi:hypothetical protein
MIKTMWFRVAVAVGVLASGAALADILLRDEGARVGPFNVLDCRGSWLTCTRTGSTALVEVAPPAQEAWQTPTFLNSWVNFGGIWTDAGYYKDSLGRVHLRGLVKDGVGAVIFNLPAGYRPATNEMFMALSNGAVARVDVGLSGNVALSLGSASSLSLSGISFRAAP